MNKTCIIIAGPTAVGKTAAALQIAKHFSTEIISADSRQCYTELNIGVAKPTSEQLAAVPHHFINSHSIQDLVSAADFEAYALQAAEQIFKNVPVAVMVGGTGLYIKAFCDGLDAIPAVDLSFRLALQKLYDEHGIDWLAEELQQNDPQYYEAGEMRNPHRMMRALEVMHSTGRSILTHHTGKAKQRDFDVIKIGLELPRNKLYDNINNRTNEMMDAGLLSEVEALLPFKNLTALQTVGYKELFAHFDQQFPLQDAVELVKQNTRRYAKRQMTWFKKDKDFTWMAPGATEEMLSFILQRVS